MQVPNTLSNLAQQVFDTSGGAPATLSFLLYPVIRAAYEGNDMMSKGFSAQKQTRYPTCEGHIW